ncbi:hypothetical protein BC834DRAFT_882673 [Gloeopeniophorella convolvens]|nr:hypothetical protein BC834DRAFT_882673 [Gloeopeniophorella convolvens]
MRCLARHDTDRANCTKYYDRDVAKKRDIAIEEEKNRKRAESSFSRPEQFDFLRKSQEVIVVYDRVGRIRK